MRFRMGASILFLILLSGCQVAQPADTTVIDGDSVYVLRSASRVPAAVIQQAGLRLNEDDRVLNRGLEVDPLQPLPAGLRVQLQVRRRSTILINGEPLTTGAGNVGQALLESGIDLALADIVQPGVNTPISAGLDVRHVPGHALQLMVDGSAFVLKSATDDVFSALAEGGAPIIGLDSAWSTDDGRIQVGRISESLQLIQEPIPFEVDAEDSPELELGLEQIVRAGIGGLTVTRTRIRYQDGQEIARQAEPATTVRVPQNRLVLRGTRLVEKTTTIDGASISYWRVLQMYATVYSPCNSGTTDGSCSTGTASGLPAGKGVVAVDPGLFAVLNGQRLYIPGYGYAIIGDVGGGYIIEQQLGISRYKWIDLGFDDDNIQDMSGWITVYFLSPAPASIPDVLK